MEWKITRNGPSELEAWDRYAAAAMVTLEFGESIEHIAGHAARVADALLLERRKRVKDDAEG